VAQGKLEGRELMLKEKERKNYKKQERRGIQETDKINHPGIQM